LVDKIDSIKRFLGGIFKSISCAGYYYAPPSKYMQLSDLPPEETMQIIAALKDPGRDPNDYDIDVELDTVSEQEKQGKAVLAFQEFDRGIIGPRDLLVATGEKDPDKLLEGSQTWLEGKKMMAVKQMNPELYQQFTQSLDAAIQTQVLDQKSKAKNANPV
jgi:hypothetical protein